jgi:hypothetical protein
MKDPKLVIPAFLCGQYAQVKRRFRTMWKRAVKVKSLKDALAGCEWIHIDDAPGELLNERPWSSHMDHVMLSVIADEHTDLDHLPDRDAWRESLKQLMWPALDEFWFCLAMAAHSITLPLTPVGRAHPLELSIYDELVENARYMLSRILRWWPDFERLQKRFYSGAIKLRPWALWMRGTWDLLRAIGHEEFISEMRELDMEEAGFRMMSFVKPRPLFKR